MTPEIIEHIERKFGGQGKLAEACGLHQSTISHWKTRKSLSYDSQRKILEAAERLGIELDANDFWRVPEAQA